jgi:hypothetical protein
MILAGVLVLGCTAIKDARSEDSGSSASPTATFVSPLPIGSLPVGPLEPGTYIFRPLDPDFDASHRITIDVPDG